MKQSAKLGLAEHLAQIKPEVPVIIMSGSMDDKARVHGFYILRKPLQRSDLARAFLELGFAAEP